MGKLFGTDGIRGIVGENLTVELAFHVGQAVAAVLTEEKGSKPTITIGKDTRISSDMLEAALTRDTTCADTIHRLVSDEFTREDFDDPAIWSDMTSPRYLELQKTLNQLRTLNSTRYLYTAKLGADGQPVYLIDGLDLGADYYLAKPFGVMELVSCVKAVLRRCRTEQEPVLRAGGIVLHPEERIVTVEGQRVTLTYKEFELLRLFLSHPGMAFTRDQLFNEIWGMDYCGETRTVDMHIRTLRQKLGSCGSMIQTVRNVGYRLEVGA